MLTQERLKEVLHYNPETGIFTWRVGRPKCKKGAPAGRLSNGYLGIGIDGIRYQAHRLAWLYVYGYFPENDIDHINRDRSCNSINNLRHVTRPCNINNSTIRNNNTSGVKGVSFDSLTKKWRARIKANKKTLHLGLFPNILDAAYARYEAEKSFGFIDCDNNSTAKQYINSYKEI